MIKDNQLIIKPVTETAKGEFDEEILEDLISQGYTGKELLEKFKECRTQVRPAVEEMLTDAFKKTIHEIREDYTTGEEKKGDLKGIYRYDVFYSKTDYEISYTVEEIDGRTVVIILVGTRENFYRELKKYIKEIG